MRKQSFLQLFNDYIEGRPLSLEEIRMLKDWLKEEGNATDLEAVIEKLQQEEASVELYNSAIGDRIYAELTDKINIERQESIPTKETHSIRRNTVRWGMGIAAGLLFALFGAVFYNQPETGAVAVVVNDTPVYDDKQTAILTLHNGEKIELQNNAAIKRGHLEIDLRDGVAKYSTDETEGVSPQYNTLTTPVGSTYKVYLSDGTLVWLNAASSITYPVLFKGNQREVSLTGEAFFEVEADVKKPFFVRTSSGKIRVTGTRFNVNVYDNEPVHEVSLVRGKVDLITNSTTHIRPGQQAVVHTDGIVAVRTANMENVLSWMENRFRFEDASIQQIMRQLDRWYGLKVIYEGEPTAETFTGSLQRSEDPKLLLDAMELSGKISFHITKNAIRVTNSKNQ